VKNLGKDVSLADFGFQITPMHLTLHERFKAEPFPPLTLGLLPLRGEVLWTGGSGSPGCGFASLCLFTWVELSPLSGKGWHIRRFGNTSALKPNLYGV
jgi:hypothetical protein